MLLNNQQVQALYHILYQMTVTGQKNKKKKIEAVVLRHRHMVIHLVYHKAYAHSRS